MKKYRIGNKVRFTVFMTLTLIIAITSFGSFFNTVESASKLLYKEVYVDSGDTIWQLAAQHNSSQIDTRKLVYNICKINNIEDQTIYPGQIIKIPVYD